MNSLNNCSKNQLHAFALWRFFFSALKIQDSVFPSDWYNLHHLTFIVTEVRILILRLQYSNCQEQVKDTEPLRHQPCGQGAAAISRQPDLGFIAIQGANNLLNRRTFDCAAIHTEHYGGREEEHFFYSCFRSCLQITSS